MLRLRRRGCEVVLVLAVMAVPAGVCAGDVYDNQINMTLTLMKSTEDSFAKSCLRLGGTLTEGEGMSRCKRAGMLLAVTFHDDEVVTAMIAYPATEEDIKGLWKKAREVFGEPDVVMEKELTWRFENGAMASAGYDDAHSAFVFARP